MMRKVGTLLSWTLLVVGAALVVVPFAYIISTSFKAQSDVFKVPMEWVPWPLRWDNYVRAFSEQPVGRYFANSVIVAVTVTVINLVTCSMAGYSFSKFRYGGRDLLFLTVISTMLIPIQVIIVPLFVLVRLLGWINSYAGLIIPAGTSAFGVFLMRQYMLSVPDALLDAARIDGASEWRIYWQVVLPAVRPALGALAIFIFTNNWSSFLWPLLVVNKESMMTLPLGIANFQSSYSTNYPELMAVSLITTLPVLGVFLMLQRQFVQSIALTGMQS